MQYPPIPTVRFPSIHEWVSKGLQEELISCSEAGFWVNSQYYLQGIPYSYKDVYLREGVVEALKRVKLPDGYSLCLWDGYRPLGIQQRLWNWHRSNVVIKHKNDSLTEEEIDFETSFFVSKPSYDMKHPSLHNTGGAIDLTLTKNGRLVSMGSGFDEFSGRSWTNHFELYCETEEDKEFRDNRRILYYAMIEAGFTNLPSEWWHYDFGTKFWAYFKGADALYDGIENYSLGKQFPLS